MITVKLYSLLRKYGGKVVLLEHKPGMIVRDIIEELNIPRDEISIIILNNEDNIIDALISREVKDDSLIHLFPPVAGG